MKAIILAAGEGIRMRPLTEDTPKPMLRLAGKPLLEHIIEALPPQIDELIFVVGYLSHQIEDYFGTEFGRFKIYYAVQKQKTGTFDALKLCEPLLDDNERFLLLYADDLHGSESLRECASAKELCLLVSPAENPKKFGVVEVGADDLVKNIEEKPENPKSNLVSTGVLLLDKSIFKFPARLHPNGEFYLTDSVEQMIEHGIKFRAVKSEFWLPIGYPSDLAAAEELLNRK